MSDFYENQRLLMEKSLIITKAEKWFVLNYFPSDLFQVKINNKQYLHLHQKKNGFQNVYFILF